jgi:hypothetical protein
VLAIAAVIVVGLLIWLLLIKDDDDESGEPSQAASATNQERIVDEEELSEFVAALGHEVYWAGPIDGAELELTNTPDGRVYIRYLDNDAELGDPRPAFLTVGTYPVQDALVTLEEAAAGDGFTSVELDGGGIATYDEAQPSSIHFAYPDSDYEIEVYDPSPERALELVTGGEIIPVE